MDEKQVEKDMKDVARFDSDFAAIQEIFGPDTGFDGIDQECMAIPFLKLAQGLTEEAMDGHTKQIPGLRPGLYFSPTTGRVYGKDIVLVVVKFYRSFMIYDGEDAKSSKFKGVITPAQFKSDIEPRAKRPIVNGKQKGYWVDDQGYRYVDARNFIVYNAEYPEDGQMLYTMASTAIPPSRQWITLMESRQVKKDGKVVTAPIWSKEWKLQTQLVTTDYTYHQVVRVEENKANGRDGWVSKEMAPVYREAFDRLRSVSAASINSAPETVEEADDPIPEAPQPAPAKSEAVSAVQNTFGGFGPRKEPARHPDAKDVEPEIF